MLPAHSLENMFFQPDNTYTGNKIKLPELLLRLKQHLQRIVQVDCFLQPFSANILNPTADLGENGKTPPLVSLCYSPR